MMIESQGLKKRFGSHTAVHNVSLRVPEGSAFALIGDNGAGKTTTLRMLVNILQPDYGEVRVLGIDSRRLTRKDFLQIGYVSENQKLPGRLTVAQYFDYLRALYENWDRDLQRSLCRDLNLPLERKIDKLSHGMRMKTVLASALAFRPKVLILDEPLSGLDPLMRDEIVAGLLRQADETTIVISSHEITEIESFTTHVAFMDRGELVFQDSTEALLARFRRVDVALSGGAKALKDLPPTWLEVETTGRSLRFVDSAFVDHDATHRSLSTQLGPIRFETEPLSLREISKALMRARKVAA